MNTQTQQNANSQPIVLGQILNGKWNTKTLATGVVKSLGKTKVKITLTKDFTKTLVTGMDVDIYFQNTWKQEDGDEPPENWKEDFKWKTNNPANKGSRGPNGKSIKCLPKDFTLQEDFTDKEKIISMSYAIKMGWLNGEQAQAIYEEDFYNPSKAIWDAHQVKIAEKKVEKKAQNVDEKLAIAEFLKSYRQSQEKSCPLTDEIVDEIVEEEVKVTKKKIKKKKKKSTQ
jgi:hypothetical protein